MTTPARATVRKLHRRTGQQWQAVCPLCVDDHDAVHWFWAQKAAAQWAHTHMSWHASVRADAELASAG